MSEERRQAYFKLIQEILDCPDIELSNLLHTNVELLDIGLVQTTIQVAEWKRFDGNEKEATFLFRLTHNIADFLQKRKPNDVLLIQQNFCKKLLEATFSNDRNQFLPVSTLLKQNLKLIDNYFGKSLIIEAANQIEEIRRSNLKTNLKEDVLKQFVHTFFSNLETIPLIDKDLSEDIIEVARQLSKPESTPYKESEEDVVYKLMFICSEIKKLRLGNPISKLVSTIDIYKYLLSLTSYNYQKNAEIQVLLGEAYLSLSKFSQNPKQDINLAISAYVKASEIYLTFPKDWSLVQTYLGKAYLALSEFSQKPKQDINLAISAYRKSLSFFTVSEFPDDWSSVQRNLAEGYLNLSEFSQNPKQDINLAISAYQSILKLFPESSLNKAYIKQSLGIAYSRLSRFSDFPKAEIEQSISSFEDILIYIDDKITIFPVLWSYTQNNLGAAYKRLAEFSDNSKQEVQKSISCFDKALQVCSETKSPQDWIFFQNNLGNAYKYLARFSDNPKQEIQQSISCFRKILDICNKTELPRNWANTQSNLGDAYTNLSFFSDNPKQEIQQSISYFGKIFDIYNETELPQDWASTQSNLGDAYKRLARFSNNPEQEIQQAIAAFRSALRVMPIELYSSSCVYIACKLGDLGFYRGMWEIAIEGYSLQVQAIEIMRQRLNSDNLRAEVHAQFIESYTNIVQALINLERYEEAIEYAERSRSQRIVDLLHTKDLYPQGNISETARQKLEEFRAKQKAIDILLRQLDSKRNQSDRGQLNQRDLSEYQLAQLKQLQAEKTEIWNSLRSDDPILAGQVKVDPLPFAKMQELIKDKTDTAILYFYFTSNTLLAFIVLPNQISLHQCPEQNDNLNNFLFENWLKVYQTDSSLWREQMPKVLGEIAQRLNLNQLIQTQIPDRIKELIIVPHLYLHQIPFAALPIDPSLIKRREEEGQEPFLGVYYRLRTISSLQILSYCHSRPAIANPTYATIENAQDNLPFAGFEGEQVAEIFKVPSDRRLIGKKNATTDNYRRLLESANSLLSAHHAESRIDDPLDSQLRLGNGFISLGELMMSRYSDISEIFLSCCETGLGAHQNLTDDILTLATGFLSAGARTVISSLWTVDDLATALFSMFYHQNIKAGSDRPTALYQAQTQLRQLQGSELDEGQPIRQKLDRYFDQQIQLLRNDPVKKNRNKIMEMEVIKLQIPQSAQQAFPFNHPFYWSSFISQGES